MVSGLILSHGTLAQAYIDASRQIVGSCDNLFALDCQTVSPNLLYQQIVELIESKELRHGLFIFVSLKGGSCWNTAARIVRDYENVELLSGLNLQIVLSFITKHKQYRFEEFGDILTRDGMRGITRFTNKGL